MQKVLSAFKLSDKKQKRLLQESQISSTDSSFTYDENIRPENSFTPDAHRSRTNSFKPMKLLRTPSIAKKAEGMTTPNKLVAERAQPFDALATTDLVSYCACCMHRLTFLHLPAKLACDCSL